MVRRTIRSSGFSKSILSSGELVFFCFRFFTFFSPFVFLSPSSFYLFSRLYLLCHLSFPVSFQLWLFFSFFPFLNSFISLWRPVLLCSFWIHPGLPDRGIRHRCRIELPNYRGYAYLDGQSTKWWLFRSSSIWDSDRYIHCWSGCGFLRCRRLLQERYRYAASRRVRNI